MERLSSESCVEPLVAVFGTSDVVKHDCGFVPVACFEVPTRQLVSDLALLCTARVLGLR
jgi:hypothetical protein